ncbi:MAG TPA: CPBP family glutamic-type intramembrane protease, partial [Tepidisphaeraceae bacterium]|nr:CPBP family glutamic-type intramembrane protease [Tepidisphaeraceae bacterium]
LLYPLLTIAMASLGKSRVDSLKSEEYKVAVINVDGAPELVRRLRDKETSGLTSMDSDTPAKTPAELAAERQRRAVDLASGAIHAVIEIPPAFQPDLIAGKNPKLTVRLDRSRTEADFAERKIDKVISAYEEWVVAQRLKQYNAPATVTKGIDRATQDVSTAAQRLGSRLSQLLPLLILVTGMLGALFPALSATTTERELGTLETLLVSPAGRLEILLAKGGLVLLCGLVTAALNVASMSLVLWRTFSLFEKADPTAVAGAATTASSMGAISPGSLFLVFVAAIPALVFFTSLVLIIGLLARTFREANSYATPAMLLPLASMALTVADVKSSPGLMVTPIANTTLIMRDVLRDKATLLDFTLAFGSSFLYAGLLLSVAARLFSNEQLVNPSWEPLSMKGLKGLGKGRRKLRLPAIDEAIALFAVSMLLLFYVQPSLQLHFLDPAHPERHPTAVLWIVVFTMLGLLFAPTALFAWLGKWNWRATFKLFKPDPRAVVAGILLGVGLVPVVQVIGLLQSRVWPASDENAKMTVQLFGPALLAFPILVPIVVGMLAGVFEELLYRGVIQTALSRRGKPLVAILVTALLFAAAHLDLHGMPVRFALGCLLGYLAWRTGSLIPAILTHFLYDTASLGLMAWEVHHRGPDALTAAAPANVWADPTLWIGLGIGAVLIGVAALLIRRTPHATPVAGAAPQRGFEVVTT